MMTTSMSPARCWASHPERIIANEMRRDNNNIDNNANFAVAFDTSYDRRNGFLFHTNPLGAIFDGQITDEGNLNSDWNTVWNVKAGRWSQGWAVEMVIPFKSLRYQGREGRDLGYQFPTHRAVEKRMELSDSRACRLRLAGIQKLSTAATMVGNEPPSQALNLELKPFATADSRTDLTADDPYSNDLDGDVGFDLKYGLTRSLTADFTYNTDFAQVEADEQQVNLTRFGLLPRETGLLSGGEGCFRVRGSIGQPRWR